MCITWTGSCKVICIGLFIWGQDLFLEQGEHKLQCLYFSKSTEGLPFFNVGKFIVTTRASKLEWERRKTHETSVQKACPHDFPRQANYVGQTLLSARFEPNPGTIQSFYHGLTEPSFSSPPITYLRADSKYNQFFRKRRVQNQWGGRAKAAHTYQAHTLGSNKHAAKLHYELRIACARDLCKVSH